MHEAIDVTPPPGEGPGVLVQQVTSVTVQLVELLGREYEVSSEEVVERASAWEQTIEVRKGSKVGADVTVAWTGRRMSITVDSGSHLGTSVALWFGLPMAAIGAGLGVMHVGPFDYLPGFRTAAVIGGLILLVPGVLVGISLSKLFTRSHADENSKLVATIRASLRQSNQ